MIRRHPLALLPLLCMSLPVLGVAAIASASFDTPGPIEMSTGWDTGDGSSGWGDTGSASDTSGGPGTTGWGGSDDGGSYTSGWGGSDDGGGYTSGWGGSDDDGTGGWDAGDDGASDDDGGSDTGDETGDFVDLWEPGEPGEPEDTWLLDFLLAFFFGDDDESGDDTGGDETAGDDTAGDDTAGDDTAGDDTGESGGEDDKQPKGCAAGEFTIFTYVKFLNGAEGTVSIAAGTLTELGSEKEGTTVYKEYIACIPGDKIVGPKAPGVRITAEVKGTNAADRVIGLRRGIDKTWISKCDADPAKKCWIDAKFNAEGKNTLPIAVAIVFVEFNRIEIAPPPKEVIKP